MLNFRFIIYNHKIRETESKF